MKTGTTLNDLAREIARQNAAKRDFLADTRKIALDEHGRMLLDGALPDGAPLMFDIGDIAHQQMAGWAGIPQKYYDRMRDTAPDLLMHNMNHWLAGAPQRRMVRTLDGKTRAFLSDRYRALDNSDVAEAILPALADADLQVMSCQITERRLYIKAVSNRIARDIPTGRMGDGGHTIFDTCVPAIVISNSEVGLGALAIETAVWTKACTNLAIFAQRSMRRYHVGGKAMDMGHHIRELLSDQTKRVTDQALWMQARDVVKAAFAEAEFDSLVKTMGEAAKDRIDADPAQVVEVVSNRLGWNHEERGGVLAHLIRGGDLTRYGLANAITRTAEDQGDYDRATDMEKQGGTLLELTRAEWRRVVDEAPALAVAA